MIMMIKVIIVMMTGEHNAGDDCDEAKQKNVCVSGYQPSLSLGYQPQFFLLPFFWLILLTEKCFQFQVYFCCNLW